MAEEKTEKPTPKKRRDERKEGHVFSSKDVIAVVSLLGTFYFLEAMFPTIYRTMRETMIQFLSGIATINELSMKNLQEIGMKAVETLAMIVIPFGIVACALAIVSTGVQTKFLFSKKAASFKMSNLSILKGIKKLFSVKNVVEILKSILKIIVLAVVLYQIFKGEIIKVARMMDAAPQVSTVYMLQDVMTMIRKVCMVFAAIAGFDYFYERWSYEKGLKMTKEEIKEEYKMTEGDPKTKGRIRNLQTQRARSRMMQAVPDADVIIRNPTHFAVALKYDIDHDNAPVLIAKGQDSLALKIVEIGQQNGVMIIENKPLARGIFASTPLDCEIPAEYYGVVAEILVQVFQMNKKKMN